MHGSARGLDVHVALRAHRVVVEAVVARAVDEGAGHAVFDHPAPLRVGGVELDVDPLAALDVLDLNGAGRLALPVEDLYVPEADAPVSPAALEVSLAGSEVAVQEREAAREVRDLSLLDGERPVGVDRHVGVESLELPGLVDLSLIHISEPTRLGMISYAVFCLKKK